MSIFDLPRLTKEYDAKGVPVTFNGGPCHGRTISLHKPLPGVICIPLNPNAAEIAKINRGEDVPIREARYEPNPCHYETTRGVVTTVLYDYVTPLSELVECDS